MKNRILISITLLTFIFPMLVGCDVDLGYRSDEHNEIITRELYESIRDEIDGLTTDEVTDLIGIESNRLMGIPFFPIFTHEWINSQGQRISVDFENGFAYDIRWRDLAEERNDLITQELYESIRDEVEGLTRGEVRDLIGIQPTDTNAQGDVIINNWERSDGYMISVHFDEDRRASSIHWLAPEPN